MKIPNYKVKTAVVVEFCISWVFLESSLICFFLIVFQPFIRTLKGDNGARKAVTTAVTTPATT
jgi:hypothetical protein